MDYSTRLASLRGVVQPSEALKASWARMERERLTNLADERGVPRDPGIRAICLAEAPSPTPAIKGGEEAVQWRESRRLGTSAPGVFRYLMGPAGSGKSSAIARCVVNHPHSSALFVAAHEIANTQRNGYSTFDELWKQWRRVDLLAIDDMGTERGEPSLIGDLLFARFNSGLITLATGNITSVDLAKHYDFGSRMADRLKKGQEMGGAPEGLKWWVAATGESLRDPKAALRLVGKGDAK